MKLTPPDQKNTLLGYREEVPPPVADAGVPRRVALRRRAASLARVAAAQRGPADAARVRRGAR